MLDASDDCWNGDPSWLYVVKPGVTAAYQKDEVKGRGGLPAALHVIALGNII